MNTGITRIEGTITHTQVDGNHKKFSIRKPNGELIDYIIPTGMDHMMSGIAQGVRIVINDTLSGPKSIVTYSPVKPKSKEESDQKVTRAIPVTEELVPA